jgi:NAD(P)-dependent dehydrogenase (short-subunit alcohol dehydrogenase family)
MRVQEIFKDKIFDGKVVFVTGGGSGINLAIAKNFAALGANIAICGRTESKLESAKSQLEELGAKVYAAPADVRDAQRMTEVIEGSREELGPIDVLVCAAAGNFLCPAEKMSPNAFKSVVDIDLIGSFNASRIAFEQLKETRGSIIFISAGMSYTPYHAQVHVGAAKAGIDNLMKNLALEWGRFGIRSNSIVPGPIEGTEGMDRLAPGKVGEKFTRLVPLGRFGQKDDVAEAAVYLASPLASYVTGTVLIVDGGQNLPGSGPFTQLVMSEMGHKG